jgi:hypothetical protein
MNKSVTIAATKHETFLANTVPFRFSINTRR